MPDAPAGLDSAERLCPACDYDLRAATGDRCPECGTVIGSIDSTIPWEHRRTLGRWRAFWRTVRIGMVARRLARATSQSGDFKDARRFAYVVAVVAAIPIVAVVCLGMGIYGIDNFRPSHLWVGRWSYSSLHHVSIMDQLILLWAAGITLYGVLPVAIALTFILWTGLPSFWVGRRGDYTCAPLVWTFIPCAAIAADVLADCWQVNPPVVVVGMIGLMIYVAPVIVLLWWWNALRVGTQGRAGALTRVALGLPIAWAIVGAVGMLALPAILGMLRIMVVNIHG